MAFLKHLSLLNFRNYRQRSFEFEQRQVFLIGPNAVGKSNLLEAIQMVALSRPPKAELEHQQVYFGEEAYVLQATYQLGEREYQYQCRRGSPQQRALKLNGVEYTSLRELYGQLLRVISFKAKDSLELVRGEPAVRRGWLDWNLATGELSYAKAWRMYQRSLRQKNQLLKDLMGGTRSRSSVLEELELWDQELAVYGQQMLLERERFLRELQPLFAQYYQKIANSTDSELPVLRYQSSLSSNPASVEEFFRELQAHRNDDLRRVQATRGPHRDDFSMLLAGHEARYYASQGQQRSCALALNLAQALHLQRIRQEAPLLLLDDVTAELDLERQKRLLVNLPEDLQVFITTTHLGPLRELLGADAQLIEL